MLSASVTSSFLEQVKVCTHPQIYSTIAVDLTVLQYSEVGANLWSATEISKREKNYASVM